MATGNVTHYSVKLASEANNPDPYKSVIYLSTTLGTAFLYFYPDTEALPNNKIRIQSGSKTYDVFYHHRYLAILIDILRNEKPVYFFFDETTKYAGILSGQEPVGEEEREH